jgi:sugar/nucleoside kinase (ribokinase family)
METENRLMRRSKMEYYRLVVNGNVDMSGKIDEGTLRELVESTGFCFVVVDDEDRPFLVYRDRDEMDRDPDGRHAIGYLTPIQEMA